MSAHLCFMAWEVPIGLPNWTRTLAYSTAMSRTRWAPPTCSAARATAARSSIFDTAAHPAPSLPTRRGGGVGEGQFGLLAGLVHGGQRGGLEAGGARLDGEHRDAGGRAGGDQHQAGRGPVEDVELLALPRP